MATHATPGSEVPDARAGDAPPPQTHQAGLQGRESELRLIAACLDKVASGSGGVIVIEGASGSARAGLLLEGVPRR